LSSIRLFLGEVFTWGDNDEGQLGDGTTNAIQRPRLVAALQGNSNTTYYMTGADFCGPDFIDLLFF
jgi:alpha-tubulin suppressor-like RCC1 family protein